MQVAWGDYDEDEKYTLVPDPWADVDGREPVVSSQPVRTDVRTYAAHSPDNDFSELARVGSVGGAAAAGEGAAEAEENVAEAEENAAEPQSGSHPVRTYAEAVEGAAEPSDAKAVEDAEKPQSGSHPVRTYAKAVEGTAAHSPDNDFSELARVGSVENAAEAVEDDATPLTFSRGVGAYYATQAEPGEYVGIRAVHSILMSATQMNLSHFHTAGMHSSLPSSRPVPSPAEALNDVYANTSMTFESSDNVYTLRKRIVGANLKSFVKSVGGSFTVLTDQENVWYEVIDKPMYSGTIIRLYIDFVKMRDHGLTLCELADASFGNDVVTHTSPDFMGMIDIDVPNDHLSQWLSRMGTPVCGTPKIKSCDVRGVLAVTHGTDVLTLSKIDSVNSRTVTSNDVNEVMMLYGIEAAAGVLHDLTQSSIVSDFMTRTGKVLYFTKNSLEVTGKGLLTSMGFERPKNDIKESLIRPHRYVSRHPSVKESIITGTHAASDFRILY